MTRTRQLHAERQAGQASFQGSTNFMDRILNETLDRLQGGNIDDTWWSRLLHQLGQQYIAPDFLKQPALQEWLAEEPVADDLKTLASAQIMDCAHENEETRTRLSQSYSDRTGESPQLANEPIDTIVAILAAGYIASVPPDQRPTVGMFQELSGQFNERFDHLEEASPLTLTNPILQQAHTEKADQGLDQILMLRAFEPLRARQNIQELCVSRQQQ